MDLIIIIILFCCCCCSIILSGGGYYYITNTSSKITSEQLPTTVNKSPTLDKSSTLDQSQITTTINPLNTIIAITTTPIPVIKWVICGNDIKGIPSIAYSHDGKLWTESKNLIPDIGQGFKSIAYDGKMWIAVGPDEFKIATSADGINWILSNYKNDRGSAGSSICCSDSRWVIVGYQRDAKTGGTLGYIITSKNGLDWFDVEIDALSSGSYFRTVVYNPNVNIWVAGGSVLAYSKNGITWTIIDKRQLIDGEINSINIINSQFIATVKSNSVSAIYSTDGITWKHYDYHYSLYKIFLGHVNRIILFNNTMIAGGVGNFHLGYSLDEGKTWIGSETSDNTNYVTEDIATNNSDVLAVGYFINRKTNKFEGQVLTSKFGKSWLSSKITFMGQINGISSNILGQISTTSEKSQITTTINPINTITTSSIPVIKWVICGNDNKGLPSIAYSYDGKLWTETKNLIPDNGTYNGFGSIAYNGKMWIAIGPDEFRIVTSIDGINWILNNYKKDRGWSGLDICWGGSLWVIVGIKSNYAGCIVTSKNGLDWSEIIGDFPILYSVKYNPDINIWVVGSSQQMFLYSKDGIEWEKIYVRDLGFSTQQTINSINVINSQFFATVATNNGNLISSPFGKIWKSFNHIRIISPVKIILFKDIMIVGGSGDFHLGYSLDQGKIWVGSVSSDATNNVTEDIATNNSDIVLAVGYFVNRTENKMLGQILTSNDGKIWTVSKVAFMSRINSIASNIPL
jgi:hypothetical protein